MGKRKASKEAIDEDVLAVRRDWDPAKKQWGDPHVLLRRRSQPTTPSSTKPSSTTMLEMPLGGVVTIFPDLLSAARQQDIKSELMGGQHFFRQYSIQGGDDPRAHFLLHAQATEEFDFSPQPGYRYNGTTMKARRLSSFPKLEKFATDMQKPCDVEDWNIGVNPVYYRGYKDHIGLHADDNQGEDCILTVVIESPANPRAVIIETSHEEKSKAKQPGDERYELYVRARDGYAMNGVMQQYYDHGILKCLDGKSLGGKQDDRLVVVLRHGRQETYVKDSGKALSNLDPRAITPRVFGRVEGLVEGDVYHRTMLRKTGGHISPQGGVSGSEKDGCFSIVVSKGTQKKDDSFDKLDYLVTTNNGAHSLLNSMRSCKPIRVFRSSSAKRSNYRAIRKNWWKSATYRYDGIYHLVLISSVDDKDQTREQNPEEPLVKGDTYKFKLERSPVGDGYYANEKNAEELIKYAIREGNIESDALVKWNCKVLATQEKETKSITGQSRDDLLRSANGDETTPLYGKFCESPPPQQIVLPPSTENDMDIDSSLSSETVFSTEQMEEDTEIPSSDDYLDHKTPLQVKKCPLLLRKSTIIVPGASISSCHRETFKESVDDSALHEDSDVSMDIELSPRATQNYRNIYDFNYAFLGVTDVMDDDNANYF